MLWFQADLLHHSLSLKAVGVLSLSENSDINNFKNTLRFQECCCFRRANQCMVVMERRSVKELEQASGLLQSGGTSAQSLSACICTKTYFSVPTCVLTRENGAACRVRCNTASCGGIALWVRVQSEDFTPSGFLMCLE